MLIRRKDSGIFCCLIDKCTVFLYFIFKIQVTTTSQIRKATVIKQIIRQIRHETNLMFDTEKITMISNYLQHSKNLLEVFVFNRNLVLLTFLYKTDIDNFKKFHQKIELPPVGIKLTTPTINGLEVRCSFHSATQTCIEWKILKQNYYYF